MMNGQVRVNMELPDRYSFVPPNRFAEKTVSLKSEVPVRFIYADGDKHTFPLEAAGFSEDGE
jgi:hypothetical protein